MNDIRTFNFFKGGNATFTVTNAEGEHYTFKIRKPSESKPFYASLVDGLGSNGRFNYIGVFNPTKVASKTEVVKLTQKSRFAESSRQVTVLRWALRVIAFNWHLPEGYAIQHVGRCCCCGRRLTDPESINSGVGPECAKRF